MYTDDHGNGPAQVRHPVEHLVCMYICTRTYIHTHTGTHREDCRVRRTRQHRIRIHTYMHIQAPIERAAASGVPDYTESEIYAHEHDSPNVRGADTGTRTTLNRAAAPPTPVITHHHDNYTNARDVDAHASNSSPPSAHSHASSPARFSPGTDTPDSSASPQQARHLTSQAPQLLPASVLPMLPPTYMHHTLANTDRDSNSVYDTPNMEHVCVVLFSEPSSAFLAALLGYMMPACALKTAVSDASVTLRQMWDGVQHQEGRFPHQVCALCVCVCVCVCVSLTYHMSS
jgi:hypothetical protein